MIDEITNIDECLTSAWASLPEEERGDYERICALMIQRGTLRIDCLELVATYVRACADAIKAEEEIASRGLLIQMGRGSKAKLLTNPAVKIKRDAEKTIANIALMLGFTPLGRKRLKGEEKQPISDLQKLRDIYDE